jgi:uncharacterized membrane protein
LILKPNLVFVVWVFNDFAEVFRDLDVIIIGTTCRWEVLLLLLSVAGLVLGWMMTLWGCQLGCLFVSCMLSLSVFFIYLSLNCCLSLGEAFFKSLIFWESV